MLITYKQVKKNKIIKNATKIFFVDLFVCPSFLFISWKCIFLLLLFFSNSEIFYKPSNSKDSDGHRRMVFDMHPVINIGVKHTLPDDRSLPRCDCLNVCSCTEKKGEKVNDPDVEGSKICNFNKVGDMAFITYVSIWFKTPLCQWPQ